VPNKTEFCGILGIKRVTFGSSCEMLCFNCQNKTSEYLNRLEYFKPVKKFTIFFVCLNM
jgi:hypothetical protein